MDNIYRRRLDREQLDRVLASAGIAPGLVRSWTELPEATFNTVYRVELDGGTAAAASAAASAANGTPSDQLRPSGVQPGEVQPGGVPSGEMPPGPVPSGAVPSGAVPSGAVPSGAVLKVAPDPDAPALAYEQGIMRTEALFHREAAAAHLPVPKVLHADFGRETTGSDLLLLSELPGADWHTLRERIGGPDRERLRTELGGLVARLHRITGPGFGYPQGEPAPDWPTAFTAMVEAVLTDADRYGAELPVSAERVRAAVRDSADVLAAVRTPALVHFDLWDGNILIDPAPPRPRISGLIDGERAFWGDPLADLVSPALFGDIERDPAFLAGYRAGGGQVLFDSATRRRLALYRCYLYLIMLTEAVPRGYGGPEHAWVAAQAGRQLRAQLEALDTVRPGSAP
ncbi:phosphotransferase family protein [Streptomyces lycii]|uniref:Aminoglycoside phosphotransferase family protein n=1 Tax=Streptomyces lycii TaxID=2654337 RepID=A0ABQ7FPI0_9ACTN|nr:aminoglycoside phosphotransferase family protein [Streptomyces lycii]KAF4410836.1 aminoglycoside phosphotransferase family protein [Streptomyces lycii]